MPPLITAGHSAKRTRHEDNTNEEEQEEEEGGEAAVEPEVYQQLTEEISALCENNVQSEELLEKKQRLRSVLLCVIRTQFPGVSLHLVGSSCNGFASNTSDADFCVMFTQSRKINQRNEALRYFMATLCFPCVASREAGSAYVAEISTNMCRDVNFDETL